MSFSIDGWIISTIEIEMSNEILIKKSRTSPGDGNKTVEKPSQCKVGCVIPMVIVSIRTADGFRLREILQDEFRKLLKWGASTRWSFGQNYASHFKSFRNSS